MMTPMKCVTYVAFRCIRVHPPLLEGQLTSMANEPCSCQRHSTPAPNLPDIRRHALCVSAALEPCTNLPDIRRHTLCFRSNIFSPPTTVSYTHLTLPTKA